MTPETIPDNSRIVAELARLQAKGPLYGSFRGKSGQSKPNLGESTR